LRPIIELLLDRGIPLWIDRPEEIGLGEHHLTCGRIVAGEDWHQQIDNALAHAHCVLFFLSRNSNRSDRSDSLYREYDTGRQRGILVPVKIDPLSDKETNPFFRIVQFIELSTERTQIVKNRELRAKFEILVDQIRTHLNPIEERTISLLGESDGQSTPPRLLPYLTNRREQQRIFEQTLDHFFDQKSRKPIVFFAIGREDQCADSFAEQMYYVSLRKRLAAVTARRAPPNTSCTGPH
jgi:hypothetical protein